jgi:hypothetical protein
MRRESHKRCWKKKPLRKPIWRPARRWNNNIKTGVTEIWCEDLGPIHVSQNRDKWRILWKRQWTLRHITYSEFLDYVRTYQPLKKNSIPWNYLSQLAVSNNWRHYQIIRPTSKIFITSQRDTNAGYLQTSNRLQAKSLNTNSAPNFAYENKTQKWKKCSALRYVIMCYIGVLVHVLS